MSFLSHHARNIQKQLTCQLNTFLISLKIHAIKVSITMFRVRDVVLRNTLYVSQQMYSMEFWCLIVVYCFFLFYCITTVTPFIERSEGWSLRSVRVLDQSQQECRFFTENQIHCKLFSSSPRGKPLLPLWKISSKKDP